MFFLHSPNKFLKFQKLANLINIKGNKLLRKVKTQWISMLSPTKRVYVEYCPLIIKMHYESSKNDQGLSNISQIIFENKLLLPHIIVSTFPKWYRKAWTTFPKAPSYDDTKHDLSPIISEKSNSCRWRISSIIDYVEGYLLCPLHNGWVQESGPCLAFNSCLGFTCIFLQDDHGTWLWPNFVWKEWSQSFS
jgi:hypothetical protein